MSSLIDSAHGRKTDTSSEPEHRLWWLRNDRIRKLGEWIEGQRDWTHIVTLTFDRNVSDEEARRNLREWQHAIARVSADCRHVPLVIARERQKLGRLHLHGLVALPPYRPDAGSKTLGWTEEPDADSTRGLDSLWHRGGSKVKRFRRGLGGGAYVVKQGDYQLDVACPRLSACKRDDQGCTERPPHGDANRR